MTEPLLRMTNVGKAFNGVTVLDDVGFELRAGETHALLGGNGAGKSTLMKILEGVYTMDSGRVELDGEPVELGSPQASRRLGISMIFQEFSLVPTLTVAQNIFLTREERRAGMLDDKADERRAAALLAELGVDIGARTPVDRLNTASMQLVEIAKALSHDARILIMDEPTASLAKSEVEALFAIIERLKARGISIVYITHRLEEVVAVADRVTVLRDGRVVGTRETAELDMGTLIEMIVGRVVERAMQWSERRPVDRGGAPLIELRGLSTRTGVRDVDLQVHAGEIVGVAGLMGSGRSELARALFGIDATTGGELLIRGERVTVRRPQDAIRAGIVLVPEDRRSQGLVLDHGVQRNLTLSLLERLSNGWMLDDREGRRITERYVERLGIRVRSLAAPVRRLSGGNQQKVVLAKWLATEPDVLVLDEPTVGVDIGTKSEIVELVRRLADDGKAVIIISSEFAELLAVADRIVVLRDGAVDREVDRSEIGDEPELHSLVQGVTA